MSILRYTPITLPSVNPITNPINRSSPNKRYQFVSFLSSLTSSYVSLIIGSSTSAIILFNYYSFCIYLIVYLSFLFSADNNKIQIIINVVNGSKLDNYCYCEHLAPNKHTTNGWVFQPECNPTSLIMRRNNARRIRKEFGMQ